MSDLVGKTLLNRYNVQEFLGRGAMAEVYKVWDSERAVHLAMKVLHADLAEDKIFLRRFKREANNLAQLQHPHIVRFYGMEQDQFTVFMLMDFVEGKSLKTRIFRKETAFTPEEVRRILKPLTSALHFAHRRGLVHCDIKPANIMLDKYGEVRLADFGIARMSDTATATMVGAGTPAYMAPEQIKGQDPTPQSDVYALGIVLYEMLTGGERPYTGEQATITGSTGEKVRWEQLNLRPTSPRLHNPDISSEVEAVIFKCLEKDPAQRYQSALDFFNAFELATGTKEAEPLQPAPVADTPVASPAKTPESKKINQPPDYPTTRLKKQKKWLPAAGIALLASLFLGFGWLMGGGSAKIFPTKTPTQTFTLTATSTEVPLQKREIFKLGIMGPYSGPSAQTGAQFKGGATMALEEYNYKIGPYIIEPVWIDSQSDPAKASQAYEQAVVQDGIRAGALNWHSSVAVAVMEITAKHKIPHIFGFGATEKVNETFESDPEKYGYWSMKGWPTPAKLDNKYVDALEYYIDQGIYAPEAKTVAIYGEDTDWGRSFGEGMIGLFEEAGWEVVSEEYFPLEQTEFYLFLNKLKDLNPAVIAGTSTVPSSITAFIKQADETGLESLIIADGLGWVDFCPLAGDSSTNVLDQMLGWSGEAGFAFADEFEQRYDLAPSTSSAGLAHDGTKMALEIMEEVYAEHGELSSELIQDFIKTKVWTGEWTMTDGLVMIEYKYTEETVPDPVLGPGFYTFPILQYSFENGKCIGKPIYPVESAVQDLQFP